MPNSYLGTLGFKQHYILNGTNISEQNYKFTFEWQNDHWVYKSGMIQGDENKPWAPIKTRELTWVFIGNSKTLSASFADASEEIRSQILHEIETSKAKASSTVKSDDGRNGVRAWKDVSAAEKQTIANEFFNQISKLCDDNEKVRILKRAITVLLNHWKLEISYLKYPTSDTIGGGGFLSSANKVPARASESINGILRVISHPPVGKHGNDSWRLKIVKGYKVGQAQPIWHLFVFQLDITKPPDLSGRFKLR